jgi:hypothetical protein
MSAAAILFVSFGGSRQEKSEEGTTIGPVPKPEKRIEAKVVLDPFHITRPVYTGSNK